MWKQILQKRKLSIIIGACSGAVLALAFLYLQNDLHRNYLDPKIPFQIYSPPAAPDYQKASSWYLNPAIANYYADPRKVDVFFIHATSYDGGNMGHRPRAKGGYFPVAPVDSAVDIRAEMVSTMIESNAIQDEVRRIQLPNYAAPFSIMGNIYAPKYRQASLYTQLTLRDDAREARAFAYGDIEKAFAVFLKTRRGGRGFVIVGVEQGGLLAERLIRDFVVPDPALKSQLVSAYFLETLVPEQQFGSLSTWVPACLTRTQTGCAFAYISVDSGRPDKALQMLQKAVYWSGGDTLDAMGSQKGVCVNPLLGMTTNEPADAKLSLGATNATGLEWGTEPALIAHKVQAHCLGGLLFVDKPDSPTFRDAGTWEDRRKVPPYNLFYGDLEADIQARWQSFQTQQAQEPAAKPPSGKP